MKRKWYQYIQQFWRGWGWQILVAVLVATSFKSAIADWNIVPTGSMKPTIVEGDRIFVDKLAYDLKLPYTTHHLASWRNPQRGDIVIFYSPEDGQRLVKRVIGIPGDTIAMRHNRLFINGKAVEYNTITAPRQEEWTNGSIEEKFDGRPHTILLNPNHTGRHTFTSERVPEKRYFVMGDNRSISKDSRYFGYVNRKSIVGRAKAVVASLDINNHYRPRWHRFFSKLN